MASENWLEDLQRICSRPGEEGATAREIGLALGLGTKAVRERLHLAKQQGLLELGKGFREDLAGRSQPVPVYRFKRKEEAK